VKLWGGRFSASTDAVAETFTASIGFDWRLYEDDIAGSAAHCRMLARQGIISRDDAQSILGGLKQVRDEIESEALEFRADLEDIHTHVESRLHEIIGEPAGRLHSARSRNDQVVLDMRMYARRFITDVGKRLVDVESVLLEQAKQHSDWVMPGYTHMQRAQPIVLGHHLLAYREMLARDFERYRDAYRRVNLLPLGAGALAGVPYPIDREYVAELLGFTGLLANSLDAVADRDFAAEVLSANAVLMAHLSRLASEITLWASTEFGFAEIDDRFAAGSSIMPQKKNPEVAELIRGKAGRVFGDLQALLTVLKGLPLSYNSDLQEDKESFFDSCDTIIACTSVMAPLLDSIKFNRRRMRQTAGENYALATDYADYLAVKGVPFREAHSIIGRMVAWCIEHERALETLSLDELHSFSTDFDEDVLRIDLDHSVNIRRSKGGTAPARVEQAGVDAAANVEEQKKWIESAARTLPDLDDLFSRPVAN
jgi:argininosuccinate lyase